MRCRAFSTSPRAAPIANACTAGVGRLFPSPATGKIKLQLFLIFRKKVLAIFLKVRYNVQAVRETATSNAPLAQLDRVFDYESKGRGFESRGARHNKYQLLIQWLVLFFYPMVVQKPLLQGLFRTFSRKGILSQLHFPSCKQARKAKLLSAPVLFTPPRSKWRILEFCQIVLRLFQFLDLLSYICIHPI